MVWHAIYTKPRWEKRVLQQLEEKGIEAYLPLYKTLKQWSDRKKLVEEPLFRGYLFVKVSPKTYYEAINVTGAVRYVSFEGKAVVVPPTHITAVKLYLNQHTEQHQQEEETPIPGSSVEIIAGPLKGIKGTLKNKTNKQRVSLLIESVGKEISLILPQNHIRAIP